MTLSDLFESGAEVQGTIHVTNIDPEHGTVDITATDEPWAFNDYDEWHIVYMWAADDCLNIEIQMESL